VADIAPLAVDQGERPPVPDHPDQPDQLPQAIRAEPLEERRLRLDHGETVGEGVHGEVAEAPDPFGAERKSPPPQQLGGRVDPNAQRRSSFRQAKEAISEVLCLIHRCSRCSCA
jgi:hypothetical protein